MSDEVAEKIEVLSLCIDSSDSSSDSDNGNVGGKWGKREYASAEKAQQARRKLHLRMVRRPGTASAKADKIERELKSLTVDQLRRIWELLMLAGESYKRMREQRATARRYCYQLKQALGADGVARNQRVPAELVKKFKAAFQVMRVAPGRIAFLAPEITAVLVEGKVDDETFAKVMHNGLYNVSGGINGPIYNRTITLQRALERFNKSVSSANRALLLLEVDEFAENYRQLYKDRGNVMKEQLARWHRLEAIFHASNPNAGEISFDFPTESASSAAAGSAAVGARASTGGIPDQACVIS